MTTQIVKLNLGCCDRMIEGFTGIDLRAAREGETPEVYQQADLSQPWRWEDSSIDEVLAYDVCEHIGDCNHVSTYCAICRYPRGGDVLSLMGAMLSKLRHPLGRIHFLNELHRVLKPGATATVETPNAARGVGYFQDPTHVSPWCLSTFKYFENGAFARTGRPELAAVYGITALFNVRQLVEIPSSGEDSREQVWKIRAILEAVK